MYPIDRRPLVKQSSIGRPVFSDRITGQKAVRSQSVLDRYKDYAAVGGADEVGATSISSVANGIASSVYPQQYRQILARRIRRSKYIKD